MWSSGALISLSACPPMTCSLSSPTPIHVGAPVDAEGEETPEGHVLRFEPGTQRIVGLTVINARWLLDRDGRLTVTIPETVQASADDLAPALAAA
jgi:hypothetical protein